MSIKKISQMTGASLATVSRVLNDPNHKCKDESVRRRVFEAARQLNYIPNEHARGLRKKYSEEQRIRYIDILVTRDQSDPFFSELLRIAEVYAHSNGFVISHIWHNCLFSNLRQCKFENIAQIVQNTYSQDLMHANGVLVLGRISKSAVMEIKKYCGNVVSLSRNYENLDVDEIICDGNKNAHAAVEHLIQLGHKSIAYVGCCDNESRYAGYQRALLKYDLIPNVHYVYECEETLENGIKAFIFFSQMRNPPTGIYCSNDIIALGLLQAAYPRKLAQQGKYMPSIVSTDDIDEAQYAQPMLTTIRIPKEEMVRISFMMLQDRIENGHMTAIKMEFKGKLIVRESTQRAENSFECEYYI